MTSTIHTTACPLDCPDTCSVAVTVTDGRITKVDAALGNELTAGFICQKVKHHARRVYAPERVLTPLIRTGPKGAGEFRTATWDEALDLVVARLKAAESGAGPESVVPYVYNSSAPLLQDEVGERFWKRFGASRVRHTVCAATYGAAYHSMFGSMLSADPLDVVDARLIVIWGANPTVSNTHLPPLVTRAQKEYGAKVVVVDPRATATAKRADLHLPVRPGTDVVLAYAVARELAERDLLDHPFLEQHASGVDEFLAAAEAFPLDRAVEICGVPAADITRLAEWLGTVRPALVRPGWGLERNRNGGSACAAVMALPVLTGQFGVPGSGVMASLSEATPVAWDPREPDTPEDRRRSRAVNMNTFGAALNDTALDPPIDVLFVQGSNLAVTNPNQVAVLAGLAREDLFTVVHEQVMTDTARFADVVLPATTHFETDDLAASYGSYVIQEMPAVIDRVGESWSNNELGAELARRMGYDLTRFSTGRAEILARSNTDGGSFDGVRGTRPAGGTVQFRDTVPSHADGKVRLAGLPGLGVPRYEALDDPYPLTLLSPATPKTINSMFGEFQPPDPAIRMHPEDLAARGLVDGQPVRVHNDRASLTTTVRADESLRVGVTTLPKGSWCRDFAEGLTVNALVPDTLSDVAGGACFNDTRVEVSGI
ncbi:MAG: molybdopterin-dependent oxidoreductase [Acidimicrobiia bacterium]|nr:molybdopterin-dependent oxidoreductase [Acidimicrobiia bacterium]